MSKVLKADASAGDAYVQKAITFPGGGWYMQYRVAVPSSTMAVIIAGETVGSRYTSSWLDLADVSTTSISFVGCGDAAGDSAGLASPASFWTKEGPNYVAGVFPTDAWNDILIHFDGTDVHYTVNGLTYPTDFDGAILGTPAFLHAGCYIPGRTLSGEVYYIDDIKVGTTLGASDLFADDFESGTFAAWDSTHGAVSIVADPVGPPAPGSGPGTWTYSLWDWKTDTLLLTLTTHATFSTQQRANRPQIFTLTMPSDTPGLLTNAADGLPNVTKLVRTGKFYRNGTLRGHGRLMQIEWNGDANTRTVTLTFVDPLLQLQNRTVFDGSGNLADPDFSSPISGAAIIKGVIDNSVTYEDNILDSITPAIFPIDTASGTFDTTMPPAVDLGAELTDWPAKIGDIITLITDTGVCDVVLRPVDTSLGFTAGIISELSVLNQAGTDKTGTVHFDYATGSYSVSQVRRVQDGTTICNKLIYYLGPKLDQTHWRGNITATETTPVNLSAWLTKEMNSRAAVGTWDTISIYDSNGAENNARPLFHSLWKTEVDLRVNGRELLYLTPVAQAGCYGPFDDYNLGDIVAVNVVGVGPDIVNAQRIYGFDITVGADGLERVGELVTSADAE